MSSTNHARKDDTRSPDGHHSTGNTQNRRPRTRSSRVPDGSTSNTANRSPRTRQSQIPDRRAVSTANRRSDIRSSWAPDGHHDMSNAQNCSNRTRSSRVPDGPQCRSQQRDAKRRQGDTRKGGRRWLTVILVVLLTVAIGMILYLVTHQDTDAGLEGGASITKYDGKSREEIQKLIDESTERSRMTISVNAQAQLKDGKVYVNVINDKDNRFYQSFTLEQNGKTLYKSKNIEQGKTIEWCDAPDAKPGEAIITIQAHDPESGKASGNPQSVKITIVSDE